MKKNFLMMAFVSLFAIIALCSCDKDDDDEGNSAISNNTITAIVENGSSYNGQIDVVKALVSIGDEYNSETGEYKWIDYEAASSTYSNGGFTLNLPANVSDSYLGDELTDEFDDISGITISDPNVKTGWARIVAYKSGKETGEFYHETTEWGGELGYANGDVSITGTYTDNYGNRQHNVHLKKGWNIIYGKLTIKGNDKYDYETTTTAPAGAKWYYYPYYTEETQGSVSNRIPSLYGKSKTRFLKKY